MTYGDPTTVETILQAIAAQVVAETDLLAERVITTLADVEYFEGDPPADQFLALVPVAFDAIEGQVTGGGANLFGTNGQLSMSLWNRFEVDWSSSDSDSLTDQTTAFWRIGGRSLRACNSSLQRMNREIASWKSRCISAPGRSASP